MTIEQGTAEKVAAKGPGRRVLVTGAAGGMCRGINARVAAAGHTVLCADIDEAAAEQAAERVREVGGVAHAYSLDVTDEESITHLQERITQDLGGIDALLNVAGILDRRYLEDHEPGTFERAIDINLNGPFRMIRVFAPAMMKQGWGRIINLSSIAGVTGYPYPSYAASKAGLSNLTRSLMVDLWGSGVTINSICPGVVDTNMVIQQVRDQVKRRVPTGKVVDPQEIGALVCFLLTDDARNINGADLLIDGGASQIFQLIEKNAPRP